MPVHLRAAVAPSLAFVVVLLTGCGGSSTSGATPVIASVSPATGTIGTIVAISGAQFEQSTTGANPTVTFAPVAGAAVDATVLSFTPTELEVAVPSGLSTAAAAGTVLDVKVVNPGGRAATVTNAFTMAAPTITDVNGGLSGSGTLNSLFIVDGNAFGDLSAATAGFSVDFRDPAGAVVATAAVDYPASDWQNIFVVGTVPGTLATGTTYKLTITTPSGTSAPASFFVQGSVGFSPSTIQWTIASALPTAKQGFPTVIAPIAATSSIYAVGGNTASSSSSNAKASNTAEVVFNQVNAATGSIANATWAPTTALPDKRGFAAAVSANGFNSIVSGNGNLYVLGGLDGSGAATSTVYYASLAGDGSIPTPSTPGTWATTTALPQPLFAHGAVVFHGHIYVAGGNDSTGTPVSTVYFAKINADGTLGAWETLPSLPVAVAYHQLVTSAGYLYVLGGDSAAVDPITNVQSPSSQGAIYLGQVNIRSGSLTGAGWVTNLSTMGKNREKFTAVVAGSYVLLSGGLYNGASTGSSEQSYAQINSDGTIASFNGATGSHTISGSPSGYDFYNHSATYFVDIAGTPHVLVLGGGDVNTGASRAGVWYQH